MDEAHGILARAREHLDGAHVARDSALPNVAYELARTAAELAVKALLLRKTGTYPKGEHNPAKELRKARIPLPGNVAEAKLSELLKDYQRGSYGFAEPVLPADLGRALSLAEAVMAWATAEMGE